VIRSDALFQSVESSSDVRMQQKALEIRKKRLGEDHPDTLRTCENLIEVYRGKGDEERAQELERLLSELRDK